MVPQTYTQYVLRLLCLVIGNNTEQPASFFTSFDLNFLSTVRIPAYIIRKHGGWGGRGWNNRERWYRLYFLCIKGGADEKQSINNIYFNTMSENYSETDVVVC